MSQNKNKKLHYIVAFYRERWGYDTTNVFVEKFKDIQKEIENKFIPNPKLPKAKVVILGAIDARIYQPAQFADKVLIPLVYQIDPDWVAKKA